MTDKVQKFRKEVERLKSNLIHGACSSQVAMETRCKEEAYDEVLAILDTMQEEPVSTRDKLRALSDGKQHLGWLDDAREVEEEPVSEGKDIFDNCLKSEEKFILPQKISGNINCENCLYSSACALGDIQACIIDKPVSEDLGEYVNELSKQFPEVSFAKLSRIAVRISRWQQNQDVKNKLPKVINRTDLDEYAYQCAYDMSNDWAIENPTWKDVEDACKLGANWQKQQDQSTIELAEDHAMLAGMEKMKEEMMKDAIEGVITFDYYGDGDKTYGCIAHDSFCLEDRGLKDNEEVKLVIIKDKEV